GTPAQRIPPPSKRDTMRELLAGEGRWLLWAGNSGPINGKNAMRAGEVMITDTTAVTPAAHVVSLPYILGVLPVPDAPLALVVVNDPPPQQGGQGSTLLAIA